MSLTRLLPTLLLAAFAALAGVAQPVGAPVLTVGELKPGQKGEVWTVFKGSQPEPFAVQVTGIVQNALGPGKDLILCELTDPRVQNMGAVAGMSGSPLYIDGKIVGVLSYQIQRFETVRYAGFTPIKDMLEVSALPTPLTPPGVPLPIPVKGARDGRSTLANSAQPEMRALAPVFSVSGLAPSVAALLEPQLQSLGVAFTSLGGNANGSTETKTEISVPATLKPGDVVAAALAVGDISIAATGTVSHVDGQRVLAFGHPMLSLGSTELPMTAAEVVTILPSQFNSIKVSNTGPVIGAFSQDRLSGIYGELGRQPHLVPVDIELPARLNRKALHFSVVRQEQILPVIAATGISQAVTGSNESGLTNGFRLTTSVEFPGEAPLQFTQVYPGPQGFNQGISEFVANLQQWLFNPYARTFPEHIRFAVEETPDVPIGYVDNLQVSRTEAAPGSEVTVSLNWRGFQQTGSAETIAIPVPAEWAGKELEVVLATGPMLDELTGRPKAVPVTRLRNFDEYLNALRARRATDGLYLAVIERTKLFSDQQTLTPEMPGSLERIARGADDVRYQRREASTPLWETRLIAGRLFNAQVRRPLQVTD